MIAIDTSLVVALFASWHEAHGSAREIVPRDVYLPAHVLIESYSVLTRLPPPHRVPPPVAATFLRKRFESRLLVLSGSGHRALLESAPDMEVSGGSVYDGLVAATAKESDATLLSRDRRALRVYEAVGVDFRMVV